MSMTRMPQCAIGAPCLDMRAILVYIVSIDYIGVRVKIPFYLLGMLQRYGPQHGYRLKQIIEEEVSDFAKIKLPTIYYHLRKLALDGYVSEMTDRDGNRPEKTIYAVTKSGVALFSEMLDEQLNSEYSPEFPVDGVLYFRDKIVAADLLEELRARSSELRRKISALKRHERESLRNIPPAGRLSAELIFAHHRAHLEAELAWLEKSVSALSA